MPGTELLWKYGFCLSTPPQIPKQTLHTYISIHMHIRADIFEWFKMPKEVSIKLQFTLMIAQFVNLGLGHFHMALFNIVSLFLQFYAVIWHGNDIVTFPQFFPKFYSAINIKFSHSAILTRFHHKGDGYHKGSKHLIFSSHFFIALSNVASSYNLQAIEFDASNTSGPNDVLISVEIIKMCHLKELGNGLSKNALDLFSSCSVITFSYHKKCFISDYWNGLWK